MYAVEAINLYKRFGELVAVDHISFKVKQGEIFGLLGPNGAGKTTTIRMLTGLIRPDDGSARIMGVNVHDDPIRARENIGVVPEEANPYPDLTVRDNLSLVGMIYGLSRAVIEERVRELISLLELREVSGRKAKALSKGTRQRLLIAMALISNPKILFLDEPTSGLDVVNARRIRSLIRKLVNDGTTILLTTHNIEEAGNICDRVAVINRGRIVALGSPYELRIKTGENTYLTVAFDKPVERDVEGFLDSYDYRIEGRKITVVCSDPGEAAERIIAYAKARKLKIRSMQTSQPSFEDVFLRLIGRGGGNETAASSA